jgi:hypothetical protein
MYRTILSVLVLVILSLNLKSATLSVVSERAGRNRQPVARRSELSDAGASL